MGHGSGSAVQRRVGRPRGQPHPRRSSTGRSTPTSAGSSSARTAPARPRCCRSPPPTMHPTTGTAEVLGERLGKVDVFELRPRIGFASTAMARRVPANETVLDVVLTAAYSVTGRWNEEYEDIDIDRARSVLAEWKLDALRRPPVRHPQRRRAEARADRPLRHDRPRAAAARRAGREPRPRRPRGAAAAARRLRRDRRRRPRSSWSRTTSRRSRRASPTPCCSSTAASSPRARSPRSSPASSSPSAFGLPIELDQRRRPVRRPRAGA